MDKPLVELFRKEISDITGYLIANSLIDSQNYPARRQRIDNIEVLQSDYWESDYWDNARRMQRANVEYATHYRELAAAGAYDLRFLDGALVQLQYEFATDTGDLRRGCASFLPAPDLLPYQDESALYLLDEVYGDVVDRRVVTVPIRFDFDSRADVIQTVHHPQSHLTIGQYPLCRVAVCSAVTPYYFLELVLRCFYRTRQSLPTEGMPGPKARMNKTITLEEEGLVHICLPTNP